MLMLIGMIAFVSYANENRDFSDRNAFGRSVGPEYSREFSTHLPLALFRLLHRLSRMVRLLISAWLLPIG